MRPKPQARGRCHSANYWDLTQILSSDVDRPNTVTVIRPAAALVRAAKDAPLHLAAHMQTLGAGTAGMGLFLQVDLHPQAFCFVGELLAHAAVRPLVDFLIVGVTNIGLLSQTAHIANHERQARLPHAAW